MRQHENMLHKKPTRWELLRRRRGFRILAEFFAGVHAANGIRHGVEPPANSSARHR
jgi:hypothetical protein